jgi:DnaJ-domain-containing protein 1
VLPTSTRLERASPSERASTDRKVVPLSVWRVRPKRMQLPGRLCTTTLGDVLGVAHRGRATGAVELLEDRGRVHRIHFANGLVAAVELDGSAPSLAELLRRDRIVDDETLRCSLLRAMASRRLHGDVLVADFHLARTVIDAALRAQLVARLQVLEQLADAQLSFRVFRVALRAPRGTLRDRPLEPNEFLNGRRRARDKRDNRDNRDNRDKQPSRSNVSPSLATRTPYQVLGVAEDADGPAIKRAYRKLVLRLHPDVHPTATEAERRALTARFAEVTAAYRALLLS